MRIVNIEDMQIIEKLIACSDDLCLICNKNMCSVSMLSTWNEWRYLYKCPVCGEYRVNNNNEVRK